jgi:hypothetical protein
MTFRILALSGVAAAALALAGCHPLVRVHHSGGFHSSGPITVLDKLDCPETEGRLTRTAAAADGQSCDYKGPDDEMVSLTRMVLPAGQTAQVALSPMEASLQGMIKRGAGTGLVNVTSDEGPNGDKANVDMPGIHIHSNGDKSQVKIFGVTVDSDNDKANVHVGSGSKQASVNADDHGATIRANDVSNGNTESVFILAGEPATPDGYHAVGYVARGPAAGPLVVAQFKTKREHHGDQHGDLDDLIARNAKTS